MKKLLFLLVAGFALAAQSQPVDPIKFQDLSYRMIGPFRAGRTVGAVGIPSQPNVFFMGVNNGGVWKTDDYGRTWSPIFDRETTGSVGDIAVSPTQPDIIYVGTGEGLHRPDLSVGDGIFKSIDGGKTWKNVGLQDVQQVGRIIVHPTNPNIVFVAGLGHPYGANEQRGVFRTIDGGASWEKVLYVNHNTGAIQVEFDPQNPQIIYADLWEHREGPWENGSFSGTNSGLYKSKDGGTTWKKLEKGLPTAQQGLGRIGIGISFSNPNRLFATVDAREGGGIYRSDDGGESWTLIQKDGRLWGRGSDFAEIRVHPKNPDVVYVANVAAYYSRDGGVSWTSFKGAPGGDDYHRMWINPLQPEIMLLVADQGAVVTVNNGKTWSSWYNQPTAQLYHVSTDNQFPYWVYGGQQESGAVGVASRGNGGQISFRDWIGVGADEYAYVAADPKNSDIIYGGRVTRFNKKTGQVQNIAPEALRSGKYRFLRTLPLQFHQADPQTLLFATNVLWKTADEGKNWEIISGDLTRQQPSVPASIGDFKTEALEKMPQRGVIYSISSSPLDKNLIWAGTDDGLVHVTIDGGKNWKDVTPATLTSWDKISQIDAGHFDKNTAYISVNAFRKDDLRPRIFKTHDRGASWQEIINGLNPAAPINAVREDIKKPGLLFAGSEREVSFSRDDGANWQSLRLNMPATSIRDLVIKDQDLVIGTHGRSIWILDDISPLRGLSEKTLTRSELYSPAIATRVRHNMFTDTPIPIEEPMGKNPPDGAILDYYLPKTATQVQLEIFDESGKLICRFTNRDQAATLDSTQVQHPMYWVRPAARIATTLGHHRFVWNLRYPDPAGAARALNIASVLNNTPTSPMGPYVTPGNYVLKLTVDGEVNEKVLGVRLDPRVTITQDALALQTDLSLQCYNGFNKLQALRANIEQQLADGKRKWKKGQRDSYQNLRGSGDPDGGDILYSSIRETTLDQETMVSLQEKFLYMLTSLQSSDTEPTRAARQAVEKLAARSVELFGRWEKLK